MDPLFLMFVGLVGVCLWVLVWLIRTSDEAP